MAPTSPEEDKCDLHDMRHSATVCDANQTTDVTYLYDRELWIMLIGGRAFSMKKTTHYSVQEEHTTVAIPNAKAMIEKNIGVRLWTRLFVRP
jgi:hypothetical protein